jgi:hypothetical protein
VFSKVQEHLHLLLAVLPLVVFVALVAWVRARPLVGWLILAGLLIAVGNWSTPRPIANLGGLALYPADVAAILLLVAAVMSSGAFNQLQPIEITLWGVVIAMMTLSILQGVSTYGLTTAGNEARGFGQTGAAAVWVWTRVPRPEFSRELHRWAWVVGLGMTCVAALNIKDRGLGNVDELVFVNGQFVTSRPLVASQALVLGLVGLLLLARSHGIFRRLIALGFLLLSVLCQHRSVWAALAVAIASLVVFNPRIRARLLGLGILTGIGVLVLYAAGTLDPLIAKFQLAIHSHGTYVDRELAWRTLVGSQNRMGFSAVLTGQPFGGGYARREPDGSIEYFAPHNWYVLLYLRIGLFGAGAIALALVRGIWRNFRFLQPIALAWGTGLMTYCYAYGLSIEVAPVLAVALGAQMAGSAVVGDRKTEAQGPGATALEVVAI